MSGSAHEGWAADDCTTRASEPSGRTNFVRHERVRTALQTCGGEWQGRSIVSRGSECVAHAAAALVPTEECRRIICMPRKSIPRRGCLPLAVTGRVLPLWHAGVSPVVECADLRVADTRRRTDDRRRNQNTTTVHSAYEIAGWTNSSIHRPYRNTSPCGRRAQARRFRPPGG